MNNIGYHQVETLLRKYPLLKSLLYNLQVELRQLWLTGKNDTISEEDILCSLAIGNKVLSDMPRASSRAPGDKELNIILTKDKIISEDIRGMVAAINTIGEVVEKTASALNGLNSRERTILEQIYLDKQPWKEVLSKSSYYLTELRGKQIRSEAIRKILPILRITQEQFDFCMNEIQEMPKERKEE